MDVNQETLDQLSDTEMGSKEGPLQTASLSKSLPGPEPFGSPHSSGMPFSDLNPRSSLPDLSQDASFADQRRFENPYQGIATSARTTHVSDFNSFEKAIDDFSRAKPSFETQTAPIFFDWDRSQADRYIHSPYYKEMGFDIYGDNESKYAQRQTFGDVMSNAFAGGGRLAWNTFVDGWAGWGRLVNALMHRDATLLMGTPEEMEALNKEQTEIFNKYAIFRTSESNEHIFNRQFLGDLIQQGGFALGTLAQFLSEELLTMGMGNLLKPLTGMSTAARMARASFSIGDAYRDAKRITDVWKAPALVKNLYAGLKAAGKAADNLPILGGEGLFGAVKGVREAIHEGAGAWEVAGIGLNGLRRTVAEANMAFTEARMEAAGTYGEIWEHLYNETLAAKGEVSYEDQQRIDALAADASWDDFLANSVVISVMNRLQFDNLFRTFGSDKRMIRQMAGEGEAVAAKAGKKPLARTVTGTAARDITDDAGKVVVKKGEQTTLAYEKGTLGTFGHVGKISKDFGTRTAAWEATKSAGRNLFKWEVLEGLQEMIQDISNNAVINYYTDLYGDSLEPYVGDKYGAPMWDKAIGDAYSDEVSSVQGLKTFLMGAVTGRITSPVSFGLQKGFEYLSTSAGDRKKMQATTKEAAQTLNAFYSNPNRFAQEWIANTKVQNRAAQNMEEALQNRDKYAYEHAKDAAFAKVVTAAKKLNMVESLVDTVREYGNTMNEQAFREAFGVDFTDENRRNVKEYTNNVANEIETFSKRYDELYEEIGDLIRHERYVEEEQFQLQVASRALHETVEWAATHEYRAKRALQRGVAIMKEAAKIPGIGHHSYEAFLVMGDDVALHRKIEELELQLESDKQATVKTEALENRIKQKEIQLDALKTFAATKDFFSEDDALNEKASKALMLAIEEYFHSVDKEAGLLSHFTERSVSDLFSRLNDYRKLKKDERDYVNARVFAANPKKTLAIYAGIYGGLEAQKERVLRAALQSRQNTTTNGAANATNTNAATNNGAATNAASGPNVAASTTANTTSATTNTTATNNSNPNNNNNNNNNSNSTTTNSNTTNRTTTATPPASTSTSTSTPGGAGGATNTTAANSGAAGTVSPATAAAVTAQNVPSGGSNTSYKAGDYLYHEGKKVHYYVNKTSGDAVELVNLDDGRVVKISLKKLAERLEKGNVKKVNSQSFFGDRLGKDMKVMPQSRGGLFIVRLDPQEGGYMILDHNLQAVKEEEFNTEESFKQLEKAVDYMQEILKRRAIKAQQKPFDFDGVKLRPGDILLDRNNKEYKVLSKKPVMVNDQPVIVLKRLDTEREVQVASLQQLRPKGKPVVRKDPNDRRFKMRDPRDPVKLYAHVRTRNPGEKGYRIQSAEERQQQQAEVQQVRERQERILRTVPPEKLLDGLTVRVIRNAKPSTRVARQGHADENPNLLLAGEPISIELLYNGESIGFLPYYNRYQYFNPKTRKAVSAPDLTLEQFVEIFDTDNRRADALLNEFREAYRSGEQVYRAIEELMKQEQQPGAAEITLSSSRLKGVFDVVVSPGQYDWVEQATVALKDFSHNSIEGNKVVLVRNRTYFEDHYEEEVTPILEKELPEEEQERMLRKIDQTRFRNGGKEDVTQHMGSYVAVVELPNGQVRFLDLEVPQASEKELEELVKQVNQQQAKTRAENQAETGAGAKNVKYNDSFNNEVLGRVFIATRNKQKGIYLDLHLTASGNLVLLFENRKQQSGGEILVKAQDATEPFKGLEDFIEQVNSAIAEYDRQQPVQNRVGVQLEAKNFKQHIDRDAGLDQLGKLLVKVSPQVVKNHSLILKDKNAVEAPFELKLPEGNQDTVQEKGEDEQAASAPTVARKTAADVLKQLVEEPEGPAITTVQAASGKTIEQQKADLERNREEELLGKFKTEIPANKTTKEGEIETFLVKEEDPEGEFITYKLKTEYVDKEKAKKQSVSPLSTKLSLEELEELIYDRLDDKQKELWDDYKGDLEGTEKFELIDLKVPAKKNTYRNSALTVRVKSKAGTGEWTFLFSTDAINAVYDAALAKLENPVAGEKDREALNNFVDRIVKGEVMTSLEDLQFYDNHKKEVEQALQARAERAAAVISQEDSQDNPAIDSGLPGTQPLSSVLGSAVDLKGEEKPVWMMDDDEVWQRSKEKGGELLINTKKGKEKRVVVKQKRSVMGPYLSYDGATYQSVNEEWRMVLVPLALEQGKYQQAIAEGRMTADDAKTIIESARQTVPSDILALVEAEWSEQSIRLNKLDGAKDPSGADASALLQELNSRPEEVVGWEEVENGPEGVGEGAEFVFYDNTSKTETRYFVRGDGAKMISAVEGYLKKASFKPVSKEPAVTAVTTQPTTAKATAAAVKTAAPATVVQYRAINWEALEKIGFERRTDKEHADFIRGKFIKVFEDKAVPREQVEAAVSLMDARAQVAAPEQPDSWYRGIEDVGTGAFKEGTKQLLQDAPFETRDGMPIGYVPDTEKVARERFTISEYKKIGSGSDRDVYDLGNGKVLKVAKTARGLEQNIYEGDYYLEGILPRVYERGLNYVIAEATPRIKVSDEVTLYDIETGEETGKGTAGEMLKEMSRFSQRDFDFHTAPLQEVLRKYGFADIMNYNVLWGDFIAKRNWGYKEGTAYHADGGTFGGVKMLTAYRNKANLSDPDFRRIYDKSRQVKKAYGDVDAITMYQKNKSGKAKGAVETLANGRKIIHALHAPNFSTAVHEIAHIFEDELSEEEKSVIKKWAGTPEWTTKTSESFARGFERYLREGKAPTAALETIFQKAKRWLQTIYRKLIGSPIEKNLSPQVREVFDGLFLPKAAAVVEQTTADAKQEGAETAKVEKEAIVYERRVDSFETSNGSVYTVLDDGRTQRYKATTGKQFQPQDLTVFVRFKDEQQEQDFLAGVLRSRQTNTRVFVVDKKGKAYHTNADVKGKEVRLALIDTQTKKIIDTVDTSTTPVEGYSTFDQRRFEENGERYREKHIGNRVVKINYKEEEGETGLGASAGTGSVFRTIAPVRPLPPGFPVTRLVGETKHGTLAAVKALVFRELIKRKKKIDPLEVLKEVEKDVRVQAVQQRMKQAESRLSALKVATSEELNTADIVSIKRFKKWVKRNLPKGVIQLQVNEDQLTALTDNMLKEGVTVGRFVAELGVLNGEEQPMGRIEIGAGLPYKYHEAFHSVFRLLLTEGQVDRYLDLAKKEVGEELAKEGGTLADRLKELRKRNPKFYGQLEQAGELEARYYEEYLADRFEAWKKDNKTRVGAAIKQFFRLLLQFLKLAKKSSASEIESLFYEINAGTYKNAAVADNRFTGALRQTRESQEVLKAIRIGEEWIEDEEGRPLKIDVYLPESKAASLGASLTAALLQRMDREEGGDREVLLEEILDEYAQLYDKKREHYLQLLREDDESIDQYFLMEPELDHYYTLFTKGRQQLIDAVIERLDSIDLKYERQQEAKEALVREQGPGALINYRDRDASGGFDTMPKELLRYMSSVAFPATDDFGNQYLENGEPLLEAIDVRRVYSSLQKAAANAETIHEMLLRFWELSQFNEQSQRFLYQFSKDIGLELNDEDYQLTRPGKEYLLQLLYKEFNRSTIEVLSFQKDATEGKNWLLNPQEWGSSPQQVNQWYGSFVALFEAPLLAKKKEDQDAFVEQAVSGLRLFETHAVDQDLSDVELDRISVAVSNQIKERLGIHLHTHYIAYSLAAARSEKKRTERQQGLVKMGRNLKAFTAEQAHVLYMSLYKNSNPFQVSVNAAELKKELTAEDTEEAIQKVPTDRSVLHKLAYANSFFDEAQLADTFENEVGEARVTRQQANVLIERVRELKKVFEEGGGTTEAMKQDPFLRDHFLLNQEGFQEMAASLRLALLTGVKTPEAKLVWDRDPIEGRVARRVEQGWVYRDYTNRDFLLSLIDLYFINKEYALGAEGKSKKKGAKKKAAEKKAEEKKKPVEGEAQQPAEEAVEAVSSIITARHVFGVPGGSNELYSINLPATKAVEIYRNQLRLTAQAEAAMLAEVKREYERIGQVQKENRQIEKEKKAWEADPKNVRKTTEIQGYHTAGEGRQARGLTLFKTGGMLGGLTQRLEQAARRNEDFSKYEKEIRAQLHQYWFGDEGMLDKAVNTLLDMGAIVRGKDTDEKYVNKMLDYHIYQGFKGPAGTFNYRRNQMLNIEAGDVEFNLAQILVNDYLNTHAFNQLLYGDAARSFSSFDEMVSRAGEVVEKGASAAFDQPAPGLGITHGGLKSHLVHLEQAVAAEGGENETWVTTKTLRYLLFGLGKLTPRLAGQLDRIERGEQIPDRERNSEGGIGSFVDPDNTLRLVYDDGIRHIELTGRMLTWELTATEDENGQWKPQPGKEALYQLKEQLEDFERRKESIALAATVGATKGQKANVAAGPAAISDWNFQELDNRFWRLLDRTGTPQPRKTSTSDQLQSLSQEWRQGFEKFKEELIEIPQGLSVKEAMAAGKLKLKLGAFQEEAVKRLISEGVDSQTVAFFGTDEEGQPRYNLNGPLTIELFTQLFFDYLSEKLPAVPVPFFQVTPKTATDKAAVATEPGTTEEGGDKPEVSGEEAVKAALELLKQNFPLLKQRLESGLGDPHSQDGKWSSFRNYKESEKIAAPAKDWLLPFTVLHSFGVQLRQQNSKGASIDALQIEGVPFNGYGQAKLYDPGTGGYNGADREKVLAALTQALTNDKEGLAAKLGLHPESVAILGNMVALGVPLYWSVLLLQQPVVQEYYRELTYRRSPIKSGDEAVGGLHTVGEDLLTEKKRSAGAKKPLPLTVGMLEGNLTMGGRNALEEYSVLNAFLQLREQTEYYTALQELLKNAGQWTATSFDRFQRYADKLQLDKDDAAFEKGQVPMDLRQVLTGRNPKAPHHALMAAYFGSYKELQSLLSAVFLPRTSLFQEAHAAVLANLDLKDFEEAEFLKQLDLDLAAYVGIRAYQYQLEQQGQPVRRASLSNGLIYNDVAESKPKGFLNCIEILNALQEKLPNNYLVNSFLHAISTHVVTTDGVVKENPYNRDGINKVVINTWAKLHRFQVERLQDGFLEIFQNEETNYLAWGLFHYLLVKDGGQRASGSFIQFVPNFMFKDLLDATGRVHTVLASAPNDADYRAVLGVDRRQLLDGFVRGYVSHVSNSTHLPSRNLSESTNLLRFSKLSVEPAYQNYVPKTYSFSKDMRTLDFDVWGGLKKQEREELEKGGFEFVKKRNKLSAAQLKFLKNQQSLTLRKFAVNIEGEKGPSVAVEFPYLIQGSFEDGDKGSVFEVVYRLESVDGKRIEGAGSHPFIDEQHSIALGTQARYVEVTLPGSADQWKGGGLHGALAEEEGTVREPVPIRQHPGFSLGGYRAALQESKEKGRPAKLPVPDEGTLYARFEKKYGVQIELVQDEGIRFLRKGKPVADQSGLHRLLEEFRGRQEKGKVQPAAPVKGKAAEGKGGVKSSGVPIHQGEVPLEQIVRRAEAAIKEAANDPNYVKIVASLQKEMEKMKCKK